MSSYSCHFFDLLYREGLPLTIKSCFYPLIGNKIFGWPGDLVDTLSG
jgi:choline-glycine betaine transporter